MQVPQSNIRLFNLSNEELISKAEDCLKSSVSLDLEDSVVCIPCAHHVDMGFLKSLGKVTEQGNKLILEYAAKINSQNTPCPVCTMNVTGWYKDKAISDAAPFLKELRRRYESKDEKNSIPNPDKIEKKEDSYSATDNDMAVQINKLTAQMDLIIAQFTAKIEEQAKVQAQTSARLSRVEIELKLLKSAQVYEVIPYQYIKASFTLDQWDGNRVVFKSTHSNPQSPISSLSVYKKNDNFGITMQVNGRYNGLSAYLKKIGMQGYEDDDFLFNAHDKYKDRVIHYILLENDFSEDHKSFLQHLQTHNAWTSFSKFVGTK